MSTQKSVMFFFDDDFIFDVYDISSIKRKNESIEFVHKSGRLSYKDFKSVDDAKKHFEEITKTIKSLT